MPGLTTDRMRLVKFPAGFFNLAGKSRSRGE